MWWAVEEAAPRSILGDPVGIPQLLLSMLASALGRVDRHHMRDEDHTVRLHVSFTPPPQQHVNPRRSVTPTLWRMYRDKELRADNCMPMFGRLRLVVEDNAPLVASNAGAASDRQMEDDIMTVLESVCADTGATFERHDVSVNRGTRLVVTFPCEMCKDGSHEPKHMSAGLPFDFGLISSSATNLSDMDAMITAAGGSARKSIVAKDLPAMAAAVLKLRACGLQPVVDIAPWVLAHSDSAQKLVDVSAKLAACIDYNINPRSVLLVPRSSLMRPLPVCSVIVPKPISVTALRDALRSASALSDPLCTAEVHAFASGEVRDRRVHAVPDLPPIDAFQSLLLARPSAEQPINAMQLMQNEKSLLSTTHARNGPRLRGKRFLVVDDNNLNVLVLANADADGRDVVDVAEHGARALEMLLPSLLGGKPGTRPYDVVLMDLHMPVLDGITATKRLREVEGTVGNAGRIPVVAVTASLVAETRSECLAAGMDECIEKPVSVDRLLHVLRIVLGESL